MVIVSVIVCTYNRARLLSLCLQSLENQKISKDLFEVLIVYNISADNTPEIVTRYSEQNKNFRSILETERGLCSARNRGWRESRGEFIAFIDDDAVAEPDWLSEILSTFGSVRPVPDACGGRVELLWESPRPVWMPDSFLAPLGKFDYGDAGFFIDGVRGYLSGSNVAFKRELSETVGFFDLSLSRKGDILLSNDEIDFFQRMYHKNLITYYNPGIRVKHHVTRDRVAKEWHLNRSYWQGRSSALMDFKNNPGVLNNFMKIGMKTGKLVYHTLHRCFYRDQQKQMGDMVIIYSCKGYLSQELQNYFKE